ncbi:MAG: hypothetical protein OCU22_08310 [Canidatus Methanoxibalbensis ujae]|nr:hypothetical protein [Candidatus Methanoxibalbensis ujae]
MAVEYLGNALIILLLVLICLIIDGVMLLIVKILPKYNLTEVKKSRWEAGNVPMPDYKYVLPMPYFGFMFLFMAVEPVIILYLLFISCHNFLLYLLLSLVLVLPAVYVGYRGALEIESSLRESVRERLRR